MSGNKYLLDTNVLLYLFAGDRTVADLIQGKQIFISFITQLELLGFHEITQDEKDKIRDFLSRCTVIDINSEIKNLTIEVRKKYKLKLPDALIAATSQYLNIPMISADKQFKKIDEINILFYSTE